MNRPIKVTNRSNGFVAYTLPEKHLRREFNPRETKTIDYEELLEVSVQVGGRELLYNYLLINDAEAMREILNVHEEPEYWLAEEKIPTWMNSCSLNEFKDALDFAPDGVKELIKKYAVSVPLNDVSKRMAIKDILKFDVSAAIALIAEDAAEEADGATVTSKRRSAATTINAINNETPKYKIITKQE